MTPDVSGFATTSVETFEPTPFLSEIGLRVRALSVERWGAPRALEMVGLSPRFIEFQAKLAKAARYREPVLITGESGVGKEGVAQAVYLMGMQKGRPYLSVNCPQHQDSNL